MPRVKAGGCPLTHGMCFFARPEAFYPPAQRRPPLSGLRRPARLFRWPARSAPRRGDHPFTAPAVRPLTMYFWKKTNSSTMGSEPAMENAMSAP